MLFRLRTTVISICALVCTATSWSQTADDQTPEDWQLHAQGTWVWQHQERFKSAYQGQHSLPSQSQKDYSFSATLFAGWKLTQGTEIYLNPELVRGVPIANLTGLGGLPNGELQKTAGADFKLYRARLFLRQTWGLNDVTEFVTSDQNQLAGSRATERIELTAGNLAVSDLFDTNRYAHDARTQFLNWSFLTHGAYDFAADARGYSVGAALAYVNGPWAIRAGRFALPKEPNGVNLDTRLGTHHGDQVELTHDHNIAGQPGTLHLLWFKNTMDSGRFDDALAQAATDGSVPDTSTVRKTQSKHGWGISLEQNLTDDLGMFARWARNNGKVEVEAFAEIDQSTSIGAVMQGNRWGRPNDTFGIGLARNGISTAHQRYLAAGGMGYFIGDGALNYAPETITEAWYSWALPSMGLIKQNSVSLDYQRIQNPAYNQDRGPVEMWAVRWHVGL